MADHTDYELLDSGGGEKLERFGARILARPSTLAVWKRRNPSLWPKADAVHQHQRGWRFPGERFADWICTPAPGLRMHLRLQDSGQMGLFPEHASYLEECTRWVGRLKAQGRQARVLNLFAYTGLATLACVQAGADVTHVDLAKHCLDWTSDNLKLNGLAGVRFIRDDAVKYLERLGRQGQKFDLVIADPPTFSRLDRNHSWTLEELLPDLVRMLVQVSTAPGRIILTSHLQQSSPEITANLFRDWLPHAAVSVRDLSIAESGTNRILPCGNYNLVALDG
ncbi:MAG: class I SAM-dependent methyltransferase [Kiritimatiellia bacterium]